MNTTLPNEDMFADFYQVGGYKNIAGGAARLLAGRGSGSSLNSFTKLAQRGRNSKSFVGLAYRQFTAVYDQIKDDFDLSDFKINKLWVDYKNQGGKVSGFMDYVIAAEKDRTDAIVDDDAIAVFEQPIPIEDPKSTKPNFNFLYIGLGAIVLVGATILIVKR